MQIIHEEPEPDELNEIRIQQNRILTRLHNIRVEQLALVITVNAWGGLIMIGILVVLSRCG